MTPETTPDRADSTGVSLRAQGSDAELRLLDAWQMQSLYSAKDKETR